MVERIRASVLKNESSSVYDLFPGLFLALCRAVSNWTQLENERKKVCAGRAFYSDVYLLKPPQGPIQPPPQLILVLLQLQLTFCNHVIESAFNRKNNHQMEIYLRSHKMTIWAPYMKALNSEEFSLPFLLWTIAE